MNSIPVFDNVEDIKAHLLEMKKIFQTIPIEYKFIKLQDKEASKIFEWVESVREDNFIRAEMRDSGGFRFGNFVVAYANNQVTGYTSYTPDQYPIKITHCFVMPAFRNLGISGILMQKALESIYEIFQEQKIEDSKRQITVEAVSPASYARWQRILPTDVNGERNFRGIAVQVMNGSSPTGSPTSLHLLVQQKRVFNEYFKCNACPKALATALNWKVSSLLDELELDSLF